MTTLHDNRDRIHEGHRAHEDRFRNAPEPFPPGSPEALEMERLLNEWAESDETAGQTQDSELSLLQSEERDTAEIDLCPRAQRRQIENLDGGVDVVWVDCGARTCRFCKPSVDERDAARIAYSLRAFDEMYAVQVTRDKWQRIRNAAAYRGQVAIKMPSRDGHDLIEVVMSAPLTPSSQPVTMGAIVELVERRPPGSPPPDKGKKPGRAEYRTTGVGLVSVKEFEEVTTPETKDKPKPRTFDMHHSITVDEIEMLARLIKIPHRHVGPYHIHLDADWDDKRMVLLRELTADPTGELDWEREKWEIDMSRNHPPPEAYLEAA